MKSYIWKHRWKDSELSTLYTTKTISVKPKNVRSIAENIYWQVTTVISNFTEHLPIWLTNLWIIGVTVGICVSLKSWPVNRFVIKVFPQPVYHIMVTHIVELSGYLSAINILKFR